MVVQPTLRDSFNGTDALDSAAEARICKPLCCISGSQNWPGKHCARPWREVILTHVRRGGLVHQQLFSIESPSNTALSSSARVSLPGTWNPEEVVDPSRDLDGSLDGDV